MKLILTIKNENNVEMYLKQGSRVIDRELLTINRNLDTLLITSIDKLLTKNKIDRSYLKGLRIVGKIRPEAVSSMIISTIQSGLKS